MLCKNSVLRENLCRIWKSISFDELSDGFFVRLRCKYLRCFIKLHKVKFHFYHVSLRILQLWNAFKNSNITNGHALSYMNIYCKVGSAHLNICCDFWILILNRHSLIRFFIASMLLFCDRLRQTIWFFRNLYFCLILFHMVSTILCFFHYGRCCS